MNLLKTIVKITPVPILRKVKSFSLKKPSRIKFLFKVSNEEALIEIGKKLAFNNFKKVSKNTLAYKKFLESNGVNAKKVNSFKKFIEIVPTTDKNNYIAKYPMNELCINGDLSPLAVIDRSSGYSGKSIYFPISKKENLFDELVMANWFKTQFNITTKDLLINCFFLGSWVAGLKIGNSARMIGTTINTGPRLDEIVETIFDLDKYYERIIILSYPPFAMMLVYKLIEAGYDFKGKNFLFLVGGEGYNLEFKQKLQELTKNSSEIFGAFGSTETGIRIGNETVDTHMLKQMAASNKEFCKKMFGKEFPPNIFQYDPTNVHLFTIKYKNGKDALVFTSASKRAVPVIKYNLKDEGGVLTQKEIKKIIKEVFNMDFNFKLPLPIFYVYGRVDDTISIASAIFYPHQIKSGLLEFIDNVIDYRLESKTTDTGVIYPAVHVAVKDKRKASKKKIEESIYKTLLKYSSTYSESIKEGIADRPIVFLYTEKDFPFELNEITK
ncbi:MAG: hypothetical protein ACTSXD_09245, partial [Candidatus Heimdallarchaeaceae archaeon]